LLSTNLGYIFSNIGNSSNSRNARNRNQSDIPSSIHDPPGPTHNQKIVGRNKHSEPGFKRADKQKQDNQKHVGRKEHSEQGFKRADKQKLVGRMKYPTPNCDPCTRPIEGVFPSDPTRKLIFIHIHKTGGTTMEAFLGVDTPSCHVTASAISECEGTRYPDHLSFTIIRHPIARAKSMYHYTKHGGNGKRMDIKRYAWVKNLKDFDSFVNALPDQRELIFAPQTHALLPVNVSSVMDQGRVGVDVSNILCLESIEDDWNELVAKEPDLQRYEDFSKQQPVRISTKDQDLTMDIRTEMILREFYAEDFIMWDHYCSRKKKQKQDVNILKANNMIWFLHFHKAGGTSFTDLAGMNGEVKRIDSERAEHSHFELDNGALRWPLVMGKGGIEGDSSQVLPLIPSSLCGPSNVEGLDWKEEIQQEFGKGTTFVSTEHWFPRIDPKEDVLTNVKFVTVLREPRERLMSSYYFHSCATRCPGVQGNRQDRKKIPCRLSDWAPMEANMYTRMLNGQPYAPLKMNPSCSESYIGMELNRSHLDLALDSLRHFDLVLSFDTIYSRPDVAECAMRQVLGWNQVHLPHSNVGNTHQCPQTNSNIVPPQASEEEIEEAMSLNSIDIELYKRALEIEKDILNSLDCL